MERCRDLNTCSNAPSAAGIVMCRQLGVSVSPFSIDFSTADCGDSIFAQSCPSYLQVLRINLHSGQNKATARVEYKTASYKGFATDSVVDGAWILDDYILRGHWCAIVELFLDGWITATIMPRSFYGMSTKSTSWSFYLSCQRIRRAKTEEIRNRSYSVIEPIANLRARKIFG